MKPLWMGTRALVAGEGKQIPSLRYGMEMQKSGMETRIPFGNDK